MAALGATASPPAERSCAAGPLGVGETSLPPPPPSCEATTTSATSTVAAAPSAGSSMRRDPCRRPNGAVIRSAKRGGRGNPSAALASSVSANCGPTVGRSSRTARANAARSANSGSTGSPASAASSAASSRSVSGSRVTSSRRRITGLPELLHRPVQHGSGVRHAHPDDIGDLGVRQAGEELQRDELSISRFQRGQARAEDRTVEGLRRTSPERGRPPGRRAARPPGDGGAARPARRCARSRTAMPAARRGARRRNAACGRRARRPSP